MNSRLSRKLGLEDFSFILLDLLDSSLKTIQPFALKFLFSDFRHRDSIISMKNKTFQRLNLELLEERSWYHSTLECFSSKLFLEEINLQLKPKIEEYRNENEVLFQTILKTWRHGWKRDDFK